MCSGRLHCTVYACHRLFHSHAVEEVRVLCFLKMEMEKEEEMENEVGMFFLMVLQMERK